MPAGIRKSGVRALNFPAGRQHLFSEVVKTLAIEFPVMGFSGIIASDSLAVEFPLFDLLDLEVSYSNLEVNFNLFETVLTGLSGAVGTLAVAFPLEDVVFTGQRATTFQIAFPLSESVFDVGLQSTGAFAIEFSRLDLVDWLLTGPPTSTNYAVWVSHLDAETHSTYTQWPVDSLVHFNGRTLVALPDGIYELTAGKDVAADVDARLVWAPSQFGNPHQKTLESIYAAARRSGSIRVIAACDETEKRKYTVDVPGSRPGIGKDRILPGRGLQGSYWQLGIENVDGSDFALIDLEVLTVPLSRRLKR